MKLVVVNEGMLGQTCIELLSYVHRSLYVV